jgi:tetratricopeptide (TPR) repeat protein
MKVFVSSTTKDLGEARKKVCDRLVQLENLPVSMDWYTSDGKTPKKLDEAKVKGCEALLIIVGHLYGSCPEGEEKSFTELEYEAAVASGKPIHPFIASNKFLISPDLQEDDATRQKLKAFRERLEKDHSPRYFDSEEQLCTEVVAALPKAVEQKGRISVPKLPQAYLAHPYPLQENFTGRLKERGMLTDWVRGQDSKPMLSLVGMGGLGKSALTWYWLHEDLPQEKIKLSGVIWWSFYEREASFESFLSHALLYASGGTINPAQIQSDYDRMQSLWCLLRDSPFLIILDGAERLLRAYHKLNVAYKGDDFNKEEGDKHLLCAGPRAGQFLQWLTSLGGKTKTLITTRLHPKELEHLAGCRREELKRLEPDDAVVFMRRQGVKGPRNTIIHACEPYDFHPLCIRLLSGAICEDPEKPGDIEAAEKWHPLAELVAREHHILQVAYDTMADDRREFLSRIASMRGPVDYETAKVLSKYENEDKLKDSLRELVARGLLFRQEEKARYDLHPIVRQYAYDRLGDKAAAHTALKDYFATVPEPERIQGLDDLLPVIELFHHTIAAGGYEEAYRVYKGRLNKPLYFQLGAYDVDISLKQAFFPDSEDKPPRLKDESEQAWILNSLAIAYDKTGQSRKAMGLMKRSTEIDEKHSEKRGVARSLVNLAVSQTFLGELKEAESNLQQVVEITREAMEEHEEAIVHSELGILLVYTGRYAGSAKELAKALEVFETENYSAGNCIVWSNRALRAILMEEPELAQEYLKKARDFWELWAKDQYPLERPLVRILWLSGAAKRRLGDLAGAENDLNDALSRCRRIRLVDLEEDILLEIAKLQWQKAKGKDKGLIDQAKELAGEARQIAERCEYRLTQADIYNFMSEMAFGEGETAKAREYAEMAKERAFCDGPPYCYKKALEEAEEKIKKINTKY